MPEEPMIQVRAVSVPVVSPARRIERAGSGGFGESNLAWEVPVL